MHAFGDGTVFGDGFLMGIMIMKASINDGKVDTHRMEMVERSHT